MTLPDLSIRRPTMIAMFYIGICIIGSIAFRMLPIEMMPNVSFGDITINIDVRGGIPAAEIEHKITKIVEESVGSVSHLKNILSISKEGNAMVILEFEPGTNMDFAALEVREKFNRIRNKLPNEIEKPVIAKYEYMDVPIMILAVTSDIRTPEDIRKIVDEKIKERIQRVEGVASAETVGGREGKIIIEVDQVKLQSYGLAINRLVDIINVNNSNLLAGEIKRTSDKYLVRTMGEISDLEDFANLAILTTKTGSVIRLKDVATVKDSYLDPSSFARMNARPVVSIYIQKESTGNTVKIADQIYKELSSLRETLEPDIRITPTFNQAEAILQAIEQVKSSLYFGAMLAAVILFILLRGDWRNELIITASMPLSLLLTFCLMWVNQLTINVMTLSGLALGVGMLIDNSIVVLDNIAKKRDSLIHQAQKLKSRFTWTGNEEKITAMEGADEMFLAIVASTATTIIVFLPLVFINPEIKMLYSGIALTIVFSLIASLLSAITLVPMWVSKLKIKRPQPAQEEILAAEEPLPSEEELKKERSFYQKFISVIVSPFLRYIVIGLVIFGLTRTLKESRKLEKEFIGIAEQNKFTVFIELPTGTKLDVSDKIVAQVEQIIGKVPEVKTLTSKIEPWSSKVYVELLPLAMRQRSTQDIINNLRPQTEKLDPAFIYFEEPEEIGTKEILLELYGYDYDILKTQAIEVAKRIQTIPKFTDTKIRMREGRPELNLIIDKKQAAYFGLTVEDISLALHTHMRGLVATHFRGLHSKGPFMRTREGSLVGPKPTYSLSEEEMKKIPKTAASPDSESKETESIVRLEERYRKNFDDLRRISFVTPEKEQVYLSQLATFKFDTGPSEIWRKNKSRMVQVSANTGGVALGTAAEKVKEVLKDFKMPKDYFWQFGGNYDKMVRNQNELGFALVISLILVYMILASLFESFTQPFIILFTVPLAAMGAVWALRLADKPIGIGALVGAIMLGGIVVNNAIVLIDRINFLRRKHHTGSSSAAVKQAVVEASADRLRPIMMTSLTTILGLIPMAFNKSEYANLWCPLAITVIGGMTISTFLTLVVIPGVYLIFRDLRLVKR